LPPRVGPGRAAGGGPGGGGGVPYERGTPVGGREQRAVTYPALHLQ